MTAASTFCASSAGAPDWSWRTTSRSQCIAFRVAAVSSSVSPLFTEEVATRHVDDVGAEPLAGQLEAGAGAGAVLEEEVDEGAAAQQVALGLAGTVEQHVALGEIEQLADLGRRHAGDAEQVAAGQGGPIPPGRLRKPTGCCAAAARDV